MDYSWLINVNGVFFFFLRWRHHSMTDGFAYLFAYFVSFCVHVCVLQHFRQLATGKTRCCSLRCFYLFFNIWDVCWFLYECMCQKGLQWLNVIMDRQPTEALNIHTKSIKFMYIPWLNYVFIPYIVFQQEVLFWHWQKNAIF